MARRICWTWRLCLLGALAPSAYAADQSPPAACDAPIKLELNEIGVQLGLISPAKVLSPPGAPAPITTAGSSSTMIARLMVGDREVGVMTGACSTVGHASIAPGEEAGDIDMCNQTLNLWNLPAPYEKLKGRIVVNGPMNRTAFHRSPNVAGDGAEQTLAVIGGTGSFRNARGELHVRESKANEHMQIWKLAGLTCN